MCNGPDVQWVFDVTCFKKYVMYALSGANGGCRRSKSVDLAAQVMARNDQASRWMSEAPPFVCEEGNVSGEPSVPQQIQPPDTSKCQSVSGLLKYHGLL